MNEEKKEYIAPKMEIIECNHEAALLGSSPCVGECRVDVDLVD